MIIDEKLTLYTLKKYLFSYRKLFNKRSFEIFVLLIISIITMQRVQSVKFIYEKFISKYWKKHINSFYYFFSDKNHSTKDIMIATQKIAISLIPEQYRTNTTIYLSIDDTLQPKFGEKFDNRYKLFDHAKHCGNSYMNGHCIVAITMSIPIYKNDTAKYITIPIGYKLYDKSCTKLELAKQLVDILMPQLNDFQVIMLCDSWYTKRTLVEILDRYSNLSIIGALRSDTVLYDLKPAPTGKRGRPRIKGERLNYKNFDFVKENDFYIATAKCLTNLYNKPVFITVTTTDIDKFSSVRLYLSSIDIESINLKYNKNDKKNKLNMYDIYKMRWNIEVMFYQQKLFWSFGAYMVRNKVAIEKYINLIGVAYSAVVLLPFINGKFKKYQFCSPQEIKCAFGENIKTELFFSNLLKIEQIKKNLFRIPFLCEYQHLKDLTN